MRLIDLVDGLMWRMSRRTLVNGLLIGAYDGDQDAQIAKIIEALALIEAHDPRRHRTMLRDLDRIWVLLLPAARGSFHLQKWCCRLDSHFVTASSIDEIASVIVHEATHARLFRRNIDYREDIRARVEAICGRHEAIFAAKILHGDKLAEDIEAHLTLDEAMWSDGAFEKRHLTGSIEALRQIGFPRWIIETFVALRLKRKRRHRLT